ncbi:hypothetical protein OnM2_026035 [Erysiphe neolycopersici]|uniref:Uncharacterized protein n=1 Tax=Erysiphe neolycopersici TaxID=212602 RepID=A0A420I0Q4_9PEZI|nr:hypothetical protein OnM2_026035 [Erysiphe neolycopersici]
MNANENHRKLRRWAEAKSVDNFGNDWNSIKDFHLSQPPFRSKRPQQPSSRTFPSAGNSQLLSNTAVVSINNRNLPALPKEEDFRSRANSFEYNDESRFSSSNVIRRHQYPSPPPKKTAPQRCLSKFVKPQTEGNIKKSFVAHPDSLVPGRSRRRADDRETVFKSSTSQQKIGLNDPQKQMSHSSISPCTSPRTSNHSQKTFPFSKSYSNPMMSREKPWGNVMVERPSTSGYNHVVTSASDKPLPFVPSQDNYQREEENENRLKVEHFCKEFFEFESSSKTLNQDHDGIGWKTSFLDPISEPSSNSNSIDINLTELSKPQLPNLSRISLFGTDIFSHLESENLHTNVKDVQRSPTVISDLKLFPLAEDKYDSDTHHVFDKVAGPKTLHSRLEIGVVNADPSSSKTNSIGSVTSSSPHNMDSEIIIQGLNKFSKITSEDTLQKTEVDKNRNSHEIQNVQSKDSIRGFCQGLTENTKIFTYDGSIAKSTEKTHTELDSSKVSLNPIIAYDQEIKVKPCEKEEISEKPGLVSIKNPTVSESVPIQKTIINNDDYDKIPKSSVSNEFLQPEKIQEPSELNDKSVSSLSEKFLDPNIALITKNITIEELEKYHSVAQNSPSNINSDTLPFDLKTTTKNSAYEHGRSKKFEPPDHEILIEARNSENPKDSENSENSMHSELDDKPTVDPISGYLSNYEDEKLQQDIVKSLNPHHDDRDDNFDQVPELLNSAEDHINTYLPSEYDNYWASTMNSKSNRHSISNTSQLPIEKNFEALPMASPEDDTLFVAPPSPRRQNDSALLRPQSSISTYYPTEDDNYLVSPISVLSPQSDFKCEPQDSTPVSPISVASDFSTRCKVQSDLNLANKSLSTFNDKTTSLELSRKHDSKRHVGSIADNFEKNIEEIDASFTQTENAYNLQSFLLDQDLSYSAQPTSRMLPKASLHDISPEQSCANKDLFPISSVPIPFQSPFSTSPLSAGRLPSFRETLKIKSSQQKTQTFDDMREIFANFDIGLGIWIRELKKKHSEYEIPIASLKSSDLCETGTYIHAREKLTSGNYIALLPHNENFIDVNLSSLPHPSNIKFTLGSHVSNTQNIYPTNKFKSQQFQAKGKDLFHTAGILSGKAGKAGKGLLAKGKNKLLSTGASDKID